jgi:Mrp family chromosome partitioning ATPase
MLNNKQPAAIAKMAEVRLFTDDELINFKLLRSSTESPSIKAFRDLRTRLLGRSNGKNFICMVVSVTSGGGSHVAANLAAAIALDKTKTSLLIDCNLHSPSIDRLLPGGSEIGLTDYLDDQRISCEDIVYGTGIKRMRAVPVGNNCDGGTEKLSSERMAQLLQELKSRYLDRYIIVDAPSAQNYEADVSLLSDICDFMVLVVPYGKVNEAQLNAEIQKIGLDRLAGVVFNEC